MLPKQRRAGPARQRAVASRPDPVAPRAERSCPGPVPSGGPQEPDPDRARWLDTLVGQALDDVEEGRMPLVDALRMVARLAWRDGGEHAGR